MRVPYDRPVQRADTNKTPQPACLCKYLNSTQQISGPLERKALVRKGSFPYCMLAGCDLSPRLVYSRSAYGLEVQ